MKKIIANCKHATFLIDKRMMGQIRFREYIGLHIHLFGCSGCRLYGKQSRNINEVVLQVYHTTPASPVRFDDRFKENLRNRIDEEMNKK